MPFIEAKVNGRKLPFIKKIKDLLPSQITNLKMENVWIFLRYEKNLLALIFNLILLSKFNAIQSKTVSFFIQMDKDHLKAFFKYVFYITSSCNPHEDTPLAIYIHSCAFKSLIVFPQGLRICFTDRKYHQANI